MSRRRTRQQAGGRPPMRQLDLFPGFESRPTIVSYEQWSETLDRKKLDDPPLRRRSESVPAPHHTGPISHATGGPLNAEESARVVRGLSIRIAGWWWPDSARVRYGVTLSPRAVCKACFDQDPAMADREPARDGLGYRRPLWSQGYRGGLSCTYCFTRILP